MKPFAIVAIILVGLSACSPQIRVYSDVDPDYDLWTYKAFDWGQKINIEEGKNPLHNNELNDKRIKAAVREQLTKRGFQWSESDPDLLLHYHIIVDDRSAVVTEPFGYRYGPYWMRTHTNVYSYREGTLILDLMDKKTGNLVWRGWAVSAIDNIHPEKVEGLIKRAVEKIFRKFPASRNKQGVSREIAAK